MLYCGHLSVFLSSLFKCVVHDSQLSRNEISFPQQRKKHLLRHIRPPVGVDSEEDHENDPPVRKG